MQEAPLSEHSNKSGDVLPVAPASAVSVSAASAGAATVQTADKPSRREALLAVTGAAAGSVLAGCGGSMTMPPSGQCMGEPPASALIVTAKDQEALDRDSYFQINGGYVWVIKDAKGYMALDTRCQHAGCPTAFEMTKDGFICGCHGSRYFIDGSIKKGPTTKPLPLLSMCRRASDNALAIDLNTVVPNRDERVT
jgi:Rieske Fe-S protein